MTPLTAERLTSPARSAIAVWQLRGEPDALDSLLATLGVTAAPAGRVTLRRLRAACSDEGADREDAEDVVCCRVDERTVELTTHGGEGIADRTRRLLADAGAETCDSSEKSSDESEARERERIFATAATLPVLERMLEATAAFEVRPVSYHEYGTGLIYGFRLLRSPGLDLIGRPNVGKSSLLNRLLGYERSVVFDREHVTRDRVRASAAFGGWPLELVDWPGYAEIPDEWSLRHRNFPSPSNNAAALVIDGSQPLRDDERRMIERGDANMIIATHGQTAGVDGAIAVDCLTGWGFDRLFDALAAYADRGPLPSVPVPLTDRERYELRQLRKPPRPRPADDA